jgi:hypothetical protein
MLTHYFKTSLNLKHVTIVLSARSLVRRRATWLKVITVKAFKDKTHVTREWLQKSWSSTSLNLKVRNHRFQQNTVGNECVKPQISTLLSAASHSSQVSLAHNHFNSKKKKGATQAVTSTF